MPEFVYHRCQPDMVGTTLYPLNALKALHPDLYARQVAKYVGREAVLDFRIPFLDLLWNDTVHTSVIQPSYLTAAWAAVGVGRPFPEGAQFFQIPLDRLASYQCVHFLSAAYWINNSPYEDVPHSAPLEEFTLFDPQTYHELRQVPESYFTYLRRQLDRKVRPLQFPQIPHILVPGPIDVAGVGIVSAE